VTDSAATTITIILGVVDTLVGLAQFFLELAKFRLARAASKPGVPPRPRPAPSQPNMARAILFGVILFSVIYAFVDNPSARAVVAFALLVVLVAMWAIRKAGRAGPPSGAFLDFLAVLIGQSVILTILAIPLPSELFLPQFVVAAVVSGLVVVAAMRRIDPA
jgi:hypothetical protein